MRAQSRFVFLAFCSTLLLWQRPALGGEPTSLRISSDAFGEGAAIPNNHTCDGADRSPALHWDGAPEGTKAFALIVDDPDAPKGNWNHWVLYNVPGAAKALAEGVATTTAVLGDGSRQGKNDFGRIGYAGPCPPKGSTHRYEFKLYALSEPLDLDPGASRDAALKAIKEKTLAKAQLTGRYGR